jgi:adenine deaminase
MIETGRKVPFHFFFGAPSCVPATTFETAGANLTAKEIEELFLIDGLSYLSEMMNYPGVLQKLPDVMAKIELAKSLGKPIDGHAPGLRGERAKQYITAGISTDHECYLLEEAIEKIQYGMKIIIREGSAAKNFEALHPLIKLHPNQVMLCSDDKHPHELVRGHINQLVRRAVVEKGYDLFDVLRCACIHPILHYGLDVGMLRVGDRADFIVIEDLKSFNVLQTYISGLLVAEKGKSYISSIQTTPINKFHSRKIQANSIAVKAAGNKMRVIEAFDGELITKEQMIEVNNQKTFLESYPEQDILKMVVVNRYADAHPAVGFIKNFGLKKGAIASSIAHDSHNIIALGVADEEIVQSINALMKCQGGISVFDGSEVSVLPLPYAGLMSGEDGYQVAKEYERLDQEAKKLGSKLQAPFMTLSFMALLVIPSLKLSDKGLFDGDKFNFVDLTSR